MNLTKKITLITIVLVFVCATSYRFYKQLESWANMPSYKEIKANYQKVGY